MTGLFKAGYEHWRKSRIPDGGGGFSEQWALIAELEGRAYPTSKNETVTAQQLQGVIIWTFASNPDAGVKEGDEIRFDGRKLRVQAVSVTSTGRRLESLCEEVR